jgi:hypothetical protein
VKGCTDFPNSLTAPCRERLDHGPRSTSTGRTQSAGRWSSSPCHQGRDGATAYEAEQTAPWTSLLDDRPRHGTTKRTYRPRLIRAQRTRATECAQGPQHAAPSPSRSSSLNSCRRLPARYTPALLTASPARLDHPQSRAPGRWTRARIGTHRGAGAVLGEEIRATFAGWLTRWTRGERWVGPRCSARPVGLGAWSPADVRPRGTAHRTGAPRG